MSVQSPIPFNPYRHTPSDFAQDDAFIDYDSASEDLPDTRERSDSWPTNHTSNVEGNTGKLVVDKYVLDGDDSKHVFKRTFYFQFKPTQKLSAERWVEVSRALERLFNNAMEEAVLPFFTNGIGTLEIKKKDAQYDIVIEGKKYSAPYLQFYANELFKNIDADTFKGNFKNRF